MKFGVIEEHFTNIRTYDFEKVCGNIQNKQYEEEYEIPRENTGTIKNQGSINACVACACTQIAEAIKYVDLIIDELKTKGYSNEDIENLTDDAIFELLQTKSIEMSEGFFYGALRKENVKSSGMIINQAIELWKEKGVIPKSYYDLLIEMPEQQKSINKIPELFNIAKQYTIGGYAKINYADKNKKDLAIKQALTQYPRIKQIPLVAISKNGFSETHCIILTGWNDKTNSYKFKNSWGSGYADNGFNEISKNKINEVYVIFPKELKLPFTDIKESDWFYDEIKHLYFSGLANGVSDSLFEPLRSPTRAEMFTLIYRIVKLIDERFEIVNKVINEKLNK